MKTVGFRMVKAYVTAYPKEVNSRTNKTINQQNKKAHNLVKNGPQYIGEPSRCGSKVEWPPRN